MKKLFLALTMLLGLIPFSSIAQITLTPTSQLLEIAQSYFQNQDVDYYLVQDNDSKHYTVFVDAEPVKNWGHKCYYLYIPKPIPSSINTDNVKITEDNFPPNQTLAVLSVKDRFGNIANFKPIVNKAVHADVPGVVKTPAQRTYAVILSGGLNKSSNYKRYWNDCSFIYQTLVNKYGVPKGNIYPIMADGTDPADDTLISRDFYHSEYESQSLDLDFDSMPDIELAATKDNITNVIDNLSKRLQKDDHFFLFVIDHGDVDKETKNSYICLWQGDDMESDYKLYDYELANMLSEMSANNVNINIVLGQCYAGGFIDDLAKINCIVSTACRASESSFASIEGTSDEFVYHWTCAVNESDNLQNPISGIDLDGNGIITMDEAFIYAKNHDRYKGGPLQEHPQYSSTPISIGEDLAFNRLAPSIDLYIKDNADDTGKYPNLTAENLWESPSIWVSNRINGTSHENPEYSLKTPVSYVNVRVHNRGKEKYTNGKSLQVYWSLASTANAPATWYGKETYTDNTVTGNNRYLTGGSVGIVPITEIPAGGYKDFKIKWILPEMMKNFPNKKFYFNYMAKIVDGTVDESYTAGKTAFDVRGNNDLAQRSDAVISKKDVANDCNIFIRNTSNSPKSYTLELRPQTSTDAEIFDNAAVEMEMTNKIYSAWNSGGGMSKGIELATSSTGIPDFRLYNIVSADNALENICLNGNEYDAVKFNFRFNKLTSNITHYTLDLVQKDENGKIVDGVTMIVESPQYYPSSSLNLSAVPTDNGMYELTVDDNDFNKVNWLNGNGTLISQEAKVTVLPTLNDNTFTVTATTEDGDIAIDNISLDSDFGIKAVSCQSGVLNVELNSVAAEKATLTLNAVSQFNVSKSQTVPVGTDAISFDISELPQGMYVVSYMIDGVLIDQKKINL